MDVTLKNYKRIKVDGKCPRCGIGDIEFLPWYYGHDTLGGIVPCCTNDACQESLGYGNEVKVRFVNHRRAKVEGLYE